MEADKSGVWFAFVVWPRNVESDTCALNFLRMSFNMDSVGFEDQTLEQAVELVRRENATLLNMMYGVQQSMMYAAQQPPVPPPSMMPLPPGAVPGAVTPPTTAPAAGGAGTSSV